MKTYIITSYPTLRREYRIKGKTMKEAYNNYCNDLPEPIFEEYGDEDWADSEIYEEGKENAEVFDLNKVIE